MKQIEALKDAIRERVSLKDILMGRGIIKMGTVREQFSCIFHGKDRKKSARYYPETDSAYCWVCRKRWDLFSWIATQEEISFTSAFDYLVRTYGVDVSRIPEIRSEAPVKVERHKAKIQSRGMYEDRMFEAVRALIDEVPFDKYARMVHASMLLKYMTSDERFTENYGKLKEAVLRVIQEANNNGS